ncbi:MAG: hypothetical protein LAP87_12195 [Acidobacteriia bacterium]|nr:hypothetical protein [Terriglobia bacterium]
MDGSVGETAQQRFARWRLAEELIRRQLPRTGGWNHSGTQFAPEPTALALLALYSSPWASSATEQGLTALMLRRRSDGLWPAVGDGAGANFWATAMADNALMIIGANPETLAASLHALVQCRPLEASWLAADFTCARLMGLNPWRVPHLAQAAEFLGNGAPECIIQLAEPLPRTVQPFEVLPEFAYLRA